jgi:hypothetical protein
MTNANKVLITRRRFEFFVLRRRLKFEMFCPACGAETDFVALDEAVAISALTMRVIVRLSDAGAIHFLESSSGHLFVCQKSLPEMQSSKLELPDEENDDALAENY